MDDDSLHGFLSENGTYRSLLSFQKAEIVYDITHILCARFLRRGDRTIDQMIQAARSGKQNIAEGRKAAATSKETEIRLTNVARASLEELLIDYEDYLRVRGLRQWERESEEALFIRRLGRQQPVSSDQFRQFCETRSAEVVANIAICLINQGAYLLSRQLRRLELEFLCEGGIRERMYKARQRYRRSRGEK